MVRDIEGNQNTQIPYNLVLKANRLKKWLDLGEVSEFDISDDSNLFPDVPTLSPDDDEDDGQQIPRDLDEADENCKIEDLDDDLCDALISAAAVDVFIPPRRSLRALPHRILQPGGCV